MLALNPAMPDEVPRAGIEPASDVFQTSAVTALATSANQIALMQKVQFVFILTNCVFFDKNSEIKGKNLPPRYLLRIK